MSEQTQTTPSPENNSQQPSPPATASAAQTEPHPEWMTRSADTFNPNEAMEAILFTRAQITNGKIVSVEQLRFVARLIPIARAAAIGRASEPKAPSSRAKKGPAAPVSLSSF